MILTVNIGNTHITIAGYEHDTLQFSRPQRWTNTP